MDGELSNFLTQLHRARAIPREERIFPCLEELGGAATFKHSPLPPDTKSTRMLWIETTIEEQNPTLCISLASIDLDTCGSYSAISYTWDGQTPTVPIECNDEVLLVTQNCYTILRDLRTSSRSQPLWIDGVCIDQSSVLERNHQVGIMGDIYSGAKEIIVWLGPWDSDVAWVLEQLPRLDDFYDPEEILREITRDIAKSRAYEDYDICDEIFGRPWFKRVWTMQEYILADPIADINLMVGEKKLPWSDIFQTLADHWVADELRDNQFPSRYYWQLIRIRESLHGDYLWSSRYTSIARLYEPIEGTKSGLALMSSSEEVISTTEDYREESVTLSQLFEISHSRQCTDLRDKVFALYSVAQKINGTLPKPDYTRSVVDIYTDAALWALEQVGTLALLHNITQQADIERIQHGLPSWVLELSNPTTVGLSVSQIKVTAFKASKDSRSYFDIEDNRRVLRIRGKELGCISCLGEELPPFKWYGVDKRASVISAFGNWLSIWNTDLTRWNEIVLAAISFWLFKSPSEWTVDTSSQFFKVIVSLLTNLPHSANVLHSTKFSAIESLVKIEEIDGGIYLLIDLWLILEGWRGLRTETGDIGFGTATMKENDRIILISGLGWPLVLRPMNDGYWMLIGHAYVHGIMNGEAWPDEAKGEELEDFLIR
ncbi:heterokaryon incompatibility protein-domain-containing protein [Dendryphion nanum]|uniref:Heterokaryon incompatibility protein-domain-containing protein n=1 Tax=Dendryphion nanum TaxID=256645 RepID=A0A9P9D4J3_9PLEO|nr:heterokaryon incompatibility protein-domain-containing protein [Dendryphion nanum]